MGLLHVGLTYNENKMNTRHIYIRDEPCGVHGRMQITKYRAGTKEILYRSPWMDNLVMDGANIGLNLIVQAMAGEIALNLNVARIGTGNTAPADGNTDLVTPVNLATTGTPDIGRTWVVKTNNTITLEFFVSDLELPNGTYEEFAVGQVIAGVYRQFSRVLISPNYSKSTNEDTQVNYQYSLTN